jgi:hypothetical protein
VKQTDQITKEPKEKNGNGGDPLKTKENRTAKFVAELLRCLGAMMY